MADPLGSVKARLRQSLETLDQEGAIVAVYSQLADDEKMLLIKESLKWLSWEVLRQRQREIERAAARRQQETQQQEEAARAVTERERQEQEWLNIYEHPEFYYGKNSSKSIGNSGNRDGFRKWCKKTGRDFDAWKVRARAAAETAREEESRRTRLFGGPDNFERDWHPRGFYAACEEQERRWWLAKVAAVIKEVAEETRLEVTAELLGSEFALGDGRRVTWGKATKEDHQQRIELLQQNAAANVEAAARHTQTIRMLNEAGVACLSEIR